MANIIHHAKVSNNKLIFKDKEYLSLFLLNYEEKDVDVIIKKPSKDRSLGQNSYYWLYLSIIAKDTGDNENNLHEYFKRALLPPKYIKVLKKEIKIPSSTTNLSTTEFSEYITKIEALTGIPSPINDFEY